MEDFVKRLVLLHVAKQAFKHGPRLRMGSDSNSCVHVLIRNRVCRALDQAGAVNELVDPLKEEGRKMPHCLVAEERNDPTARKAFDRLTDFLDSHSV